MAETAVAPKKSGGKKNSFGLGKRIQKYFTDLRSEVKKIVWPSMKQLRNNTLVVIAFCVLSGAFVWVLDFAFSQIIRLIYG